MVAGRLWPFSPVKTTITEWTHYFSTHGCKVGLGTSSFSFPDLFLLGARA